MERVMFDSGYMAKRVVLDEGKDLIRASANNYYMNVTQREVEEFYRTSGEEDSCPVSRGLNSGQRGRGNPGSSLENRRKVRSGIGPGRSMA